MTELQQLKSDLAALVLRVDEAMAEQKRDVPVLLEFETPYWFIRLAASPGHQHTVQSLGFQAAMRKHCVQ